MLNLAAIALAATVTAGAGEAEAAPTKMQLTFQEYGDFLVGGTWVRQLEDGEEGPLKEDTWRWAIEGRCLQLISRADGEIRFVLLVAIDPEIDMGNWAIFGATGQMTVGMSAIEKVADGAWRRSVSRKLPEPGGEHTDLTTKVNDNELRFEGKRVAVDGEESEWGPVTYLRKK